MHYSIRVLDDLPVSGEPARTGGDINAARGLTDRLKELLTDRVESNAGA
jgi:hypothetical protein